MANILEPGYFYHIYNRGNNNEIVFPEERNYDYFLTLATKYLQPVSEVYCYCLLPTHFHLLIRIKEINDLQFVNKFNEDHLHQPFSNFFNAYTKAINKATGRHGSLFQKNFSRIRVQDESFLKNLVAYIHLNPVKHGMNQNFHFYNHSSYQSLLSEKPTKLMRTEVINWFDDMENFTFWHNYKKIKLDGIL